MNIVGQLKYTNYSLEQRFFKILARYNINKIIFLSLTKKNIIIKNFLFNFY